MRRAPCVTFFCDAFCRPRCSPRISFPLVNSACFVPQQSEQLRFSCFGSRSQRFGMHIRQNRDRNGSNSHRPTHITTRPVGRMAGTGCVDRGRGVQPSIAGAWCIRPSQARGASFHRGRGVHLSIAGPGSIAVADCSCPGQCCSAHANPAPRACAACRRWRCCRTHAWLHARAQLLRTQPAVLS